MNGTGAVGAKKTVTENPYSSGMTRLLGGAPTLGSAAVSEDVPNWTRPVTIWLVTMAMNASNRKD